MNSYVFVFVFLISLSGLGFSSVAFGQGVQTAGGVNVDGTWYLGEGLKEGDYFEYSLCELDLNDCAPIKLKMWIKGTILNESETLWDTKVVIIDGNKIVKGSMGLGAVAPEPITFDDDLHDYAIALKSSLTWLSAFATSEENDYIHGPKEFRQAAWGKIGAIGGAQLIPKRAETITVPAATVDSIVLGWYSGDSNEIWIVDDFPFPVKALTYAWVTTGVAPIMYQFTLLDYQENLSEDPFENVESTIDRVDLLDCPTVFHEYTSGRVSTNTNSMMIQYNYSPETPIEGCNIDWKINFMSKYNDVEFIDQVHYDIWVTSDDGTLLRSYAQDLGRESLFNGFGQIHLLLPVEEKAGVVNYTIFVHGTGSEYEIPDASMGGYATIEVEIGENPLYRELIKDTVVPPTSQDSTGTSNEVPSWIKTSSGFWVDGNSSDGEFVSAVQFLIKEGIIQIPPTTQGSSVSTDVPSWIKTTVGFWVDGNSSDGEFISAMQFLIKEGIMSISS